MTTTCHFQWTPPRWSRRMWHLCLHNIGLSMTGARYISSKHLQDFAVVLYDEVIKSHLLHFFPLVYSVQSDRPTSSANPTKACTPFAAPNTACNSYFPAPALAMMSWPGQPVANTTFGMRVAVDLLCVSSNSKFLSEWLLKGTTLCCTKGCTKEPLTPYSW